MNTLLKLSKLCSTFSNKASELGSRLRRAADEAEIKRQIIFKQERKEKGFSRDELWSLDYSLAKLIAPRLKAFKENTCGRPGCFDKQEDWETVLDKMIYAFEFLASEERWNNHDHDGEEWTKVNEGLDLFREYYLTLWY